MRKNLLALACAAFITASAGCGRNGREPSPKAAEPKAAVPTPSKIEPSEAVPPTPKQEPPPIYALAPKEKSTIDGLSIHLDHIAIANRRTGEYVQTVWVATTDDGARKYDLKAWGDGLFAVSGITLKDDKGNTYKPVRVEFPFNELNQPELESLDAIRKNRMEMGIAFGSAFGSGEVTSERARWGPLYFEKPAPAAKWLYLELDAKNAGLKGAFRFQFDAASAR